MRCKKHVTDPSSGEGVCASCLRERLFPILAVQSQLDQSPPSISLTTAPISVVPTSKREKPSNTSSFYLPSLFRSRLKHAAATSSHPPSWLSALFSTKKTSAAAGRRRDVAGGGMSPASDCGGGCSPPQARGGAGCAPPVSNAGFVFCISPLVFVRPKRPRWNSKSNFPVKAAVMKPRLEDVATSFCTNRSRKVADFGKEGSNW